MTEDKKHTKKELNAVKQLTVKEAKIGPTILLDSSFILACLSPRDPNHTAVESIFGFIKPYNCRIHIPLYVFAEIVSRRVHEEKKVSRAIKDIEKFISQFQGGIIGGSSPSIDEIISRYKELARKKIRFLQSNDFFIASEGILLKSIILTCDHSMYEKVKKYYKDIYYVAKHSTKYKDDIAKFIKQFERMTAFSGGT